MPASTKTNEKQTTTLVTSAADSSTSGVEQPNQEQEQPERAAITTDQVIPITAVGNSLIAVKGGKYSSIARLSGTNAKLMSGGEKHRQVKRISRLFNSTQNPFAYYCMSKPRSMRGLINEYDRKRLALKPADTVLKQQYWIVRDDLERKERERSITQRDYYVAMQANSADLKSSSGFNRYRSNDSDEDEPKIGILQNVLNQLQVYLFGKDPEAVLAQNAAKAIKKGKGKTAKSTTNDSSPTQQLPQAGEGNWDQVWRNGITPTPQSSKIPAGLLDTLGFKMRNHADALTLNGMRAEVLSDAEILRMLTEQFSSKPSKAELLQLLKNGPDAMKDIDPLNLISRADFSEQPDHLTINNDFVSSLVVTEYPRNFKFSQLFEIIRFKDIRMSVALHVLPLTVKQAESKLRNRQQLLFIAESESKSSTGNMDRAYKIESIRQLRAVLASGDARIFQVCIVVSVRAKRKRQLKEDLQRVAQRFSDLNFEVAYPTNNQRRAWLSSLPIGINFLAGERLIQDRITHPNMTGENVACLLPNCISDFIQIGGIPLGSNRDAGTLVTFNRWLKTSTNPHTIIIATTGGGKTVTQMHECMGEFLKNPDMEGYIIDIQNVMGPFCQSVNGVVIDLSVAGKQCINPMDRYVCLGRPESIGERLSFFYALFVLMLKADLAPAEKNAIGHAAKRIYHHFEEGESSLGVIFANLANNALYAPLRLYLNDYPELDQQGQPTGRMQPGIMTKLGWIYDALIAKHKIPSNGLVEGYTNPYTGKFSRAICRLYDGIWYYCGEGETDEPYVEPDEIKNIPAGKSRPAAVWYPHPDWWQSVTQEYTEMVEEEGIFDALDLTAREPAIRDAALELKRGMPVLGDFLPYLIAEGAVNLANNLEQYTDEELFGPVFNHYTNINLDSRFISWNCKDLDEGTLRPIRMFQVINLVWARVRAYRRRRMFICDEFQTLVQNFTDVANFVRDLFQRGRAFRLSMTAIVQNITALLDYPQALICCQNADRIVLLKQNPLAIDRLQGKFDLTDGEVEILQAARQGEALMKVGNNNWTHVQYQIAPQHLKAWDTNTDTEGTDEQNQFENDLLAFESIYEEVWS